MNAIRRDYYRKKVAGILSCADDEAFFQMVWAVHALQTDREKYARAFIIYPKEAATNAIGEQYSIYPWMLETMLGELLCTAKYKPRPGKRFRMLDCRKFHSAATVYNLLLKIENVESGIKLKNMSVLKELPRIAHRQFEWQRGFVSGSRFYRYALMYGGPATSAHFQARRGVALDKFMLVGLTLMAGFQATPWLRQPAASEIAGLADDEIRAAINAISISLEDARRLAKRLRSSRNEIAYQRNVLREFPCLIFGDNRERLRAPIPDLIALRCTSGLFHDFIDAGSHIRNEIADRFESYCLSFFRKYAGIAIVNEQLEYRFKKNNIRSPDILIKSHDEVHFVIECKATRMNFDDKFTGDPSVQLKGGYEEMVKGAFQIWRFVAHCRRGLVADTKVAQNAHGVVLTLDYWLSWTDGRLAEVIEAARRKAQKECPEIRPDDMIPIVFCPIDDLEHVLCHGGFTGFVRTVKAAASADFRGWDFAIVHDKLFAHVAEATPYPFMDRMSEVLPWWNDLFERATVTSHPPK